MLNRLLKKKSTQSTIALVLVTAAWGLTFPLIKDSIENIPPFSFVAFRFLIAGVFLFLVA
jgi:drug/metabolite transporter (DMT)-like permease